MPFPVEQASMSGFKRPAVGVASDEHDSHGSRKKRKSDMQPATAKLELPDNLKTKIYEVLNEKQTGDKVEDLRKRVESLTKVCNELAEFDSSFRISHFVRPDHEVTNYKEEDRILVNALGDQRYEARRRFIAKDRAVTQKDARKLMMADKSLDRDTRDPFDQNNPIKYKGKAIHEFNGGDLIRLSSDDAHEIIKLISKIVLHIAVGFNTVPTKVIQSVSSGMGLVLSYLDNRKSEFSLTKEEGACITMARKRFQCWKASLSLRKN